MKAAVLHAFGQPPRYDDFPDPEPGADEAIVRVRAASLKNVDRARAKGTHYDRHAELPVVCGVDAVGVLDDGTRVYCGGPRAPYGTMAERTVVSRGWTMAVPDAVDDVQAAALPNPALSSWLPLVWRAKLERGETVLVLGATGVAGKLAVQIAKHLGAGRVVAAGRNARVLETLPELGADAVVALNQSDDDLTAAFRRAGPFDVVLDYLWGRPTTVLLGALGGHDLRAEPMRTRVVEIGSMAGPTIPLSAETLRSAWVEIHGSGGGSIPRAAIFETLPKMWALAATGALRVDTDAVPLADVERAWQRQDLGGRRLVFVP
jgi:NADPH2:quinone reductase